MSTRTLRQTVRVAPQPGTGILHPFPTPALPHLDPFVFLDTGLPRTLGPDGIYVGPHPHRGVQPVSLLFRGQIEHRDSLGNHRTVHSGGMQWLVAGRGALHEEILHGDDDGVFHMAQLWVNVPAARKLDPPEHHAASADAIPELRQFGNDTLVRLYAGTLDGSRGPAPMPSPVIVAQAQLGPQSRASIPVPRGWTAGVTIVDGTFETDGTTLDGGATAVFADDGTHIELSSSSGGVALLMFGEPIGEPIAAGGGFVMNESAEVEQAFADYKAGHMGALAPSR